MKEALEILLKNIANLFKVKTIITLAIIIVFTILALKSLIPTEMTASIISAVITYYFTKDGVKG